jgi:hypothetical protein
MEERMDQQGIGLAKRGGGRHHPSEQQRNDGPPTARGAAGRHRLAMRHVRTAWLRRAGVTGALLAMIAVATAFTG